MDVAAALLSHVNIEPTCDMCGSNEDVIDYGPDGAECIKCRDNPVVLDNDAEA